MKKSNLFWVMMMALIVMSCSKDETTMSIPQDSNAITFGTYVGRDAKTRATVLNLGGLQGFGFGVFAYYTDGVDFAGTSTPNFMYNQHVTWGVSGTWYYSPLKYWPNEASDKLTFFAYAPYNAPGATFSGKTATGAPTLTYTLGVLADQRDLLWATPVKDKAKQNIDVTHADGNVKFTFNHALSRLGFKVIALSDVVNGDVDGDADADATESEVIDGTTTIKVTSVEITGTFPTVNTLNLETGAWNATATTSDLKAYSLASDNFEAVANAVTTTKAQLNDADSYLMLLPGGATGITVKVVYTVTTEDDNLATASVITNTITSGSFDFSFEQGKAYDFVLHLGLTSVKFDAEVNTAGWGTETDHVVNVPINTTPAP